MNQQKILEKSRSNAESLKMIDRKYSQDISRVIKKIDYLSITQRIKSFEVQHHQDLFTAQSADKEQD